jgi:RimJ/RimL family protein N-acetyltransferase
MSHAHAPDREEPGRFVMRYMVIERFKDARAIYRRLRERGRMMPAGLISRMTGVANLGYWVRSSLAGRGIAPAAVLQLVSWAFQHTALHRLEIVVAVGNRRSQHVAEKVGAHRDAVLRKRTEVTSIGV